LQTGAGMNALACTTPAAASASMLGVAMIVVP
jgi:hypothetical protein